MPKSIKPVLYTNMLTSAFIQGKWVSFRVFKLPFLIKGLITVTFFSVSER